MGWGGRQTGGSGWGTHVNPWLIHVNIWQKPLQNCKVKKIKNKKIRVSFPKKGERTSKYKINRELIVTGKENNNLFNIDIFVCIYFCACIHVL